MGERSEGGRSAEGCAARVEGGTLLWRCATRVEGGTGVALEGGRPGGKEADG